MRVLAVLEKIDEPKDMLIDKTQFRITNLRYYGVIDSCLDYIRNIFSTKHTYIKPSLFSMDIPGICTLDVIPGKKIQKAIWQQAKDVIDKQPKQACKCAKGVQCSS